MNDILLAFYGGVIIGFAALLLLLFNGRILGISGVLGGIIQRNREPWRYLVFLGLIVGGIIIGKFLPSAFEISIYRSPYALIVAGLLVGYGTRLGKGCTSGHGVCGVSRLSKRSIVATCVFMATGAATVFVITHFFGGRI